LTAAGTPNFHAYCPPYANSHVHRNRGGNSYALASADDPYANTRVLADSGANAALIGAAWSRK
jgi:hypothetical protein